MQWSLWSGKCVGAGALRVVTCASRPTFFHHLEASCQLKRRLPIEPRRKSNKFLWISFLVTPPFTPSTHRLTQIHPHTRPSISSSVTRIPIAKTLLQSTLKYFSNTPSASNQNSLRLWTFTPVYFQSGNPFLAGGDWTREKGIVEILTFFVYRQSIRGRWVLREVIRGGCHCRRPNRSAFLAFLVVNSQFSRSRWSVLKFYKRQTEETCN